MKNRMKKWLAFMLVVAMTFTLSATAFAEEDIAAEKPGETVEEMVEQAEETEEVFEEITEEDEQDAVTADETAIEKEAEEMEDTSATDAKPGISYSVYMNGSKTWVDGVDYGVAGVEDESDRIDAIKISLTGFDESEGGVQYRVYKLSTGWSAWAKDGEICGSTTDNKRIEIIQVQLYGSAAEKYSVYYASYVRTFGWTDNALDGKYSGSHGYSKRIEAVKIGIAEKDSESVPSTSDRRYFTRLTPASVSYTTEQTGYGTNEAVTNGKVSGHTASGKRLTGFAVNYTNQATGLTGTILYRAYVEGTGWTDWMESGQLAGTAAGGERINAIQMKLTGELAEFYDIYYRSYVVGYKWLGWAKNGQLSGSKTTLKYRMEALQIKLQAKTTAAPGANSGYYKTSVYYPNGDPSDMNAKVQSKSSSTKWLIAVDTTKCRLGVYTGSKGKWTLKYYWKCSPGKPSTQTPKGEFRIGGRGKSFSGKTYTCWYYTQFKGSYLFHSVLYEKGSMTKISVGTLGKQLSHGCVRLHIDNAKWINQNIPTGTKVYIYK